ncbi:potassium-transporting ATPase subunit KdpC [Cytophagaceae bacterium DM2B3-1]|uniref:Potassium-transporting ATPase KdpC subunit n=1 Tax=Xanthocytophaga flava TaxID=3048013 RepID=A0ABT7CF15_9BACT|nr:potassium-transporting ATPase subunit KdpC [Xanthocytophaga flavus]MDJ1492318.1 potassium-transporting ATPase subunit KdpC [Xanthocytophaga flavus]
MLSYLKQSVIITLVLFVFLGGIYPLFVVGIARILGSNEGKGEIIKQGGKIVGFANIAQPFTSDKYFNSRPSAFNFDATNGSYGSNAGPSNPDYLATVQSRIDTFLVHNPGVNKSDIPSELVTASGSGLDPHLSPEAAYVQIARIAQIRKLSQDKIKALVDVQMEDRFLGIFGPRQVNVLKLNLALDNLK